jgi:hypothetical protein
MEIVFKEFPISLEYVLYFLSTAIVLFSIVFLEAGLGLALLTFCAGLIGIFFAFLACWDLFAIGIVKHRVFGVIFAVINFFLFLGLIFDFVQAL